MLLFAPRGTHWLGQGAHTRMQSSSKTKPPAGSQEQQLYQASLVDANHSAGSQPPRHWLQYLAYTSESSFDGAHQTSKTRDQLRSTQISCAAHNGVSPETRRGSHMACVQQPGLLTSCPRSKYMRHSSAQDEWLHLLR
jgi:hypothetical protein